MPQLSISNLADGIGSLAEKINELIAAVKTAYDMLDATNFDSSTAIPNSALRRPKAYTIGEIIKESIPQNQLVSDIQEEIHIPTDFELAEIRVVAGVVTAPGAQVEIDFWLTRGTPSDPTAEQTILAAQIVLAEGSLVKGVGTLAWTSFLEGDLISMRAVTGAGESIGNFHATLLFKAKHTT